ncbi:hypothetical protein Ahy_A07g033008 [Arachis hypogaea]|uniref:Transposase MuDR plant domain-containing protein n=1 Tax=Arachis hypogaea TaxID=3818 RepID=A0A445C8A3_ARAHY|nr:hypothetical protein Ahy_A07g033008 [Arachis hypogaea]
MEFSSRKAVIKAMKDYTIHRGVNYPVYESESTTFYAKCTQYGGGCDWLIKFTKMQKKYYWQIRRYNGSHTCTRFTISQDHSKLDSKIVTEAIKRLVEVDPSIKVSCFDRENEVFEVREMPSRVEYAVDLCQHRFDCSEFQVDRISCRHVFACCANQRLDWQVYVYDVYKMDQV